MQKQIKINIVICTFNRESYIKRNLASLNKCHKYINHVYIIDNASNLKIASNKFCTIVKNKNLGGSGGFARGIYESKKDKKCTHVWLMDDDITFELATIRDAYLKIKRMDGNDWLGFAMMEQENPLIKYEMGAYWNGISSHRNNESHNLLRSKYNYSAWWSIIIPISSLNKYNYPLPFFIKFDDIEYGMRRTNEKIIFGDDFKIWHPSFKNKYKPYLEYYQIRNSFITNSLHFRKARLLSLIRYIGKCIKLYFRGQFQALKMANVGCNDFFAGPKKLFTNNLNDLNAKIISEANESINIAKEIFLEPLIILNNCFKILLKFNSTKQLFIKNKNYLSSEQYWKTQFRI